MYRQESSSAQPGGEINDGSIMPTQERQRSSFSFAHFSFDYKAVAQ